MKWRYKLTIMAISLLLVGFVFISALPQNAFVSAEWGNAISDDTAIYSVSLGVYGDSDIGIWYRGENDTLSLNPSNPINRICVTVSYNESTILRPNDVVSCIFIIASIHEQYNETYTYATMTYYSHDADRNLVTFRALGLNYDVRANTNYFVDITYKVILK